MQRTQPSALRAEAAFSGAQSRRIRASKAARTVTAVLAPFPGADTAASTTADLKKLTLITGALENWIMFLRLLLENLIEFAWELVNSSIYPNAIVDIKLSLISRRGSAYFPVAVPLFFFLISS
jgi:hypothetical protein